jgi:hypothetical protein
MESASSQKFAGGVRGGLLITHNFAMRSRACVCRKLDSAILMVEAAKDRS